MHVVTTNIPIANYIRYIIGLEDPRSLTVIFHSGVTREDHQINTPFPMDMAEEALPLKNRYDIEISAIEFRCVCTMMIACHDILALLIALKINSPGIIEIK